MSKESFIVHVCGAPFGIDPGSKAVYKGPWTHMRSEGTWLLSVALNLARNGHPVTIAMYDWGDYPIPENVSFTKEFKGKFDYYIDVGGPWEIGGTRMNDVKAGKYIWGWGGSPNYPEFLNDNWKDKWRVARPNACYKEGYDALPPNRGLYMPIPAAEKQYPPNVSANMMLWGSRGAFNNVYTENSELILQLMERHPEYNYLVLLFGDIREKASVEIVERFKRLPNGYLNEPYYGLDHDELISRLKQSAFLLSNGTPGCNPLPIEAVCYGGITLVWTDSPFQPLIAKYGYYGANVDELIGSKDNYIKYQKAQAEIASDHIWDNAYRIFMKELQDGGD